MELPRPGFFDGDSVSSVWKVDYERVAREAVAWRQKYRIPPAAHDETRICLLAIDVQNTFCTPEYELFVAGHSETAAVDDTRRLCEFLYRNLSRVTTICPTMDTHYPFQIFHPLFLVDREGNHPSPYTTIGEDDLAAHLWRINPAILAEMAITEEEAQAHFSHYARVLKESARSEWTIWPFHSLLGGTGHALVSAFQEAVFFHSVVRQTQPRYEMKGSHTWTEHYSALGPEVTSGPLLKNSPELYSDLPDFLTSHEALIIAGEAKSHCLAWTVRDLLNDPRTRDMAPHMYLLNDCTSPVVVAGGPDYSRRADLFFEDFAQRGVHIVNSTDPIREWPDFPA
jgi:nicotinamidase-related amidase